MDFMEKKDLFEKMVSQQIGNYEFKNPKLLLQAFTRRSYTEENGGENNEVLEFIGDKVLDIAVVRYLVCKYGNAPKNNSKPRVIDVRNPYVGQIDELTCALDEGELTKLKQRLVQKETLARRIDELQIADFLRMGKGDIKGNYSHEKSVKEDLFEAILGAVAIDSNWDFDKIQEVVETMLNPDALLASDDETDYVSLIYEWDEVDGVEPFFKYWEAGYMHAFIYLEKDTLFSTPESSGIAGYDKTTKTCVVRLRNGLPTFAGFGTSNNEARKAACKEAYKYLKEKNLLHSIRDEIKDKSVEMAINNLEILARRGFIAMPRYVEKESHDKDGNPIWNVKCYVDGFDVEYSEKSSSKKNAKKAVAYKMLMFILDNYKEDNL